MKGASTLLAALALVAVLLLEPTANAVVHRLTPTFTRRPRHVSSAPSGDMTPLDRVASHHGIDWTSAQQRLRQQQQKTTSDNSCDSGSQSGSRVNLDLENGYMLTAEMDIGSPEQGPFDLLLSFATQQPYVLKKGAKYTDGTKVRGVEEFNAKSSNTAQQQNADFSSTWLFVDGSVVSDTLQIGELSINQSVQVAKKVDPDFEDFGIDGILGLGVSSYLDGSSFVEQLASQLDSPVLTLYASQSLGQEDGQGVLSFGDRLPETCKASSWMKISSYLNKYGSWPSVDTVSVTGPADSNGCGGKVALNITVAFYHDDTPIYCSWQLQDLFVRAAGARWSWYAQWWVVDDASEAVPVEFHTANGDVIKVNPNDYLLEIDGTQYLNVYGYYDQTIYAGWDYIALTQSYLNNHCLSMDMTSGQWSLADVQTPSEATYDSSSSDSAYDGADYIARKH